MTRPSELVMPVVLGAALSGCGYHLANESHDPLGPFEIAAAPAGVPYAEAIVAAEAGARAELARSGQLGRCRRAPCAEIVVEILRVDEQGEGVALARTEGVPRARGMRITVIGRARVRSSGETQRDTGDVSVTEVVANEPRTRLPGDGPERGDPVLGELEKAEASRRAARRLGERMVRRILGSPEPSSE